MTADQFGDLLRGVEDVFAQLRQSSGVSYEDLGKQIGISKNTVLAFEKHQKGNADLSSLFYLCLYYRIPLHVVIATAKGRHAVEHVSSKYSPLVFERAEPLSKNQRYIDEFRQLKRNAVKLLETLWKTSKLSLSELSNASEISVQTLRDFFSGTYDDVTLQTLYHLTSTFSLGLDDIFEMLEGPISLEPPEATILYEVEPHFLSLPKTDRLTIVQGIYERCAAITNSPESLEYLSDKVISIVRLKTKAMAEDMRKQTHR